MNTFPIKSVLFSGFAAITGIMSSSCVAPYEVGVEGPSQSVATYRSGYQLRSLPQGYRTEVIEDTSYYTHNGTYYRPHSGGYIVVDAPTRRQANRQAYREANRQAAAQERYLNSLPSGYRTVTHRGDRYYQVNDTYYQQRDQGYVVVRSPY